MFNIQLGNTKRPFMALPFCEKGSAKVADSDGKGGRGSDKKLRFSPTTKSVKVIENIADV